MSHPLSLAFLTVADIGPVESIRVAAEAGYGLVGLRLLPASPTEAPYPLMVDPAVLKEAVRTLKETGVGVGDVEIIRLKDTTKISEFDSFLEYSAELGARHVLVAGDDPDEARLTDNFASFCDLAADYSLTADLEFMPWTQVPDLKTASRIVEAAGKTNGAVLVDALHLERSGSSLEDVRALPHHRVNYVQFCDGLKEHDSSVAGLIEIARAGRLVPGEGEFDLVGLAKAIPDDVVVSVEVPNRKLAAAMPALERALKAREGTEAVLARAGRQR